MVITREVLSAGKKEGSVCLQIELTDAEIEEAYRVRQREYQKDDAEQMLDTLHERDQISVEERDRGLSLLDEIADRYEKDLDCNIPENTQWESACRNVLKGE